MSLEPRQNYGLGSIVKSVTKGVKSAVSGAVDAVKDVAKSDIGKAALIYGATAGLGSLGAGGGFGSLLKGSTYLPSTVMANLGTSLGAAKTGLFGKTFIPSTGTAAAKGFGYSTPGILGKVGLTKGAGSMALTGLGTTAAISGLTGFLSSQGMEEEEIETIKRDPELLSNYLGQYYKNLNPEASPQEVANFVRVNTMEYRADGGRIGYQDGTPKEGIETLIPMQKPDNDVQYVRDMIKSLDGFAQLIAQKNNLDRQTFQGHMDLFEDFRQRNDIDAMPAYTYLQRRVQELNPEVAKMIYITQEDNPNKTTITRPEKAYGGRMGFEGGGYTFEQFLKDKQQVDQAMSMEELRREYERMMKLKNIRDTRDIAAMGGRMGYALGDRAEDNAMQASNAMGLPLNQNPAGVTELDLRETGGFIPPVGVKEKADDIPAMLSNNEFVFTADAVRGMGDGDVNKGAQRMYDMMKKLENGGRV